MLRTRLKFFKEHKLSKLIFKRGFALICGNNVFQAWGCSYFVNKTFRDDVLCQ
jgi:hypothetical protein